VPDDDALAGGDDIQLAEFLLVPLTTFRLPAGEIGARAAEVLIANLSDDRSAVRRIVLRPTLGVRESSGGHR
jgi:LacI family transcriptional regulator